VNTRTVGKRGEDFFEKPAGIYRRSKVAHVPREHLVELTEQFRSARRVRQLGLLRLAHLIPDLPIEGLPHRRRRLQRQKHRHLMAFAREIAEVLVDVAQFDMPATLLAGDAKGVFEQNVLGRGIVARSRRHR
jgi:hypothetical protein